VSNYIPPDGYNVDLNFNEVAGTVDAHNVVLNFGADEVITASIDAVISTAFLAEITTLQGSVAQIDCVIATDFNAEITAVVSNQFCSIDAVINTSFVSN
jgi:hypothetical protein